MADGHINIKVTVDGKEVDIAAKSLDNLGDSGQKSWKDLKSTEEGLKGVGNQSAKSEGGIKKFAASLGLVAIGAAAFKALSASMDDGIKRFDTLNKFPKVLQSLGVSAEDSEKSISKLSDGIDGLPTKLNDIASNAQRMYTSFGDMDKATDSALALNNALLGSGSSAGDAQRGTEQYLKVLQTGKMELDTWNTLSETMDVALVKVADSFGYTGRSAKQDLYKALQDGSITIDQFNDKLVELGTGTGELAELARVNSLGMATSLENLKGAFSRGIAGMLESLNKLSKEATGKEVAEHIDSLKVIINAAFKVIGKVIESATPLVKGFIKVVNGAIPVVKALSPAIAGVMAAYAGYKVISKVQDAIKKSNAIFEIAKASKTGLTLVTKAHTTAIATDTGMTQAQTVATLAQTGAINLSQLAVAVFTGQIGLLSAAKVIATAVTYAFKAALDVLLGPIGLAIAAIGLLVAGVVALVKWFNKENAETKRLSEETEALADATSNLAEEVENTSKAYEDSKKDIVAQGRANKKLAKEVMDLAKKENKSAAEKMLLKDKIEQLNGSVEGLNLSYNEEAKALNMSNEQLEGRVGLMEEQATYTAAIERQTEAEKELQAVQMQISEVMEKRKEWNEALENETVTSGEAKKALKDLDEQSKVLGETHEQVTNEYKQATEEAMTAAENVTNAVEEGNLRQITSYEDLSEEQKTAFDNMKTKYDELAENATNAFDKMNDKSSVTAEEMIKNLEHNQEMTKQWGEDIAELYDRAGKQSIDEGFIKYLEDLGPDSAAEVAEVTKMSDTELQKYAELMANGGTVAAEALETSLGEGFEGIIEDTSFIIDDVEKSLRNQITESGLKEVGELLPESISNGMENGKEKVSNASVDMAKEAEEAFKKEAEINSPSKVFTRAGETIPDGLVLGVSNGTNKVIETMANLSKNMIAQFDSSYSVFNSIGRNITAGLNSGLNAGRRSVMSTARSIANEITYTMKKAQGIHSPARVPRDQVGKMIPAGIGVGFRDAMPKLLGDVDRGMSALTQRMSASTQASMPSPSTTSTNNSNLNLGGTIRVEGVNNEGELISVVEIVKEELRKEARF